MKMAELKLLPAVRSADESTIVVADGVSCRHQIRDGAKRDAIHVSLVLASALTTPPMAQPKSRRLLPQSE